MGQARPVDCGSATLLLLVCRQGSSTPAAGVDVPCTEEWSVVLTQGSPSRCVKDRFRRKIRKNGSVVFATWAILVKDAPQYPHSSLYPTSLLPYTFTVTHGYHYSPSDFMLLSLFLSPFPIFTYLRHIYAAPSSTTLECLEAVVYTTLGRIV
ncbi:hypothetical protein C8F01DRAFT_272960 [Mycena amicta]|nr:hypothetical protein C8F01DRAFT_272960 [Mycena amicta]